jgi:hypothetical protein
MSLLNYFYIEGKIKYQALNAIQFIIFLHHLEWCFPDGLWQDPRVSQVNSVTMYKVINYKNIWYINL